MHLYICRYVVLFKMKRIRLLINVLGISQVVQKSLVGPCPFWVSLRCGALSLDQCIYLIFIVFYIMFGLLGMAVSIMYASLVPLLKHMMPSLLLCTILFVLTSLYKCTLYFSLSSNVSGIYLWQGALFLTNPFFIIIIVIYIYAYSIILVHD